MIEKKTLLKLVVYVMVTLFITILLVLWKTGFCFSRFKYLSDQELIEMAVHHVVKTTQGDITVQWIEKKDGEPVRVNYEPEVRTHFESVQDFLEKNPYCCAIATNSKPKMFEKPDLVIMVRYKINFLDDKGIERVNFRKRLYHITECGVIKNPGFRFSLN